MPPSQEMDWAYYTAPNSSTSSSVEDQCPTQYIIGHFGDDFYRLDNQTNTVKKH